MKTIHTVFVVLALAGISLANAKAEQKLITGFAKREVFLNLTNELGLTVADLTANPKFINNQPDSTTLQGSFEAPPNAGLNYGQRVSGLLVPPTSGAYVFFIASDDQSELWLSTSDDPANKQLVASVTEWTGSREWNKYPGTQDNTAAPITLEAGTPYYIEALMVQGGGGDNLAVGWVLPGQYVDPNNPPDGLANISVIPGQYLRAILPTTSAPMMIMPESLPPAPAPVIVDGATNATTTTGTDFGSRGVSRGSRDLTYTIYNVGATNLELTGNPTVGIGGAQAGDFVVTVQPAATVPPGGSTPFTVRFDPSAAGIRTATVTIAHGDGPANPYDFAIQGLGLGGGAGVLGNDSEGVTWAGIGNGQIYGNRFASPRDMRITGLHAKVLDFTGTLKGAVYSDTNGLADRLLMGSVDVVDPTNGWNTLALTSPLDLNAGDNYWLVLWSDSTEARAQFDAVGSMFSGNYFYADLGGQWPDPISLAGPIGLAGIQALTFCLYAEGTPANPVAGAAIDVRGNGKLIVSGDTTPSSLDGTDFGTIAAGSGTREQVFTLENLGDTALQLTDSPPVSIVGPHASDFSVTAQPTSPVPPGGNTTFKVRFRPSVRGPRLATISIANNDPNGNPYVFAVQGSGFISGRESIWPDTKTGGAWAGEGALHPYELGTVFRASVPGKITHIRVYSITLESGNHTARIWRNDDETVIAGPYIWNFGGVKGWLTLDIPDVDIEADTDYTVVVSTGEDSGRAYCNVAAEFRAGGNNGQHLSFPVNAGVFADGVDNLGTRPTSSYNGGAYLRDIIFMPAGVTVDLPDMSVTGNSIAIPAGDLSPSSTNGTDFGQTATGGGNVVRTFTIKNIGTAPLNLSASPKVAISGPQAVEFAVITQPTTPIPPAGASSFTIRFTPAAAGARNAIVSIDNDSDENPYEFAITGAGAAVASVRITAIVPNLSDGSISLQWEGGGPQFQVEKAPTVTGPFQSVGAAQAERLFSDPGALKNNTQSYYRVRPL